METKPWWAYLLDLLAGLWTKDQLAQAGAGPDALKAAVTAQVALPTFGGPQGPPAGLEDSRDLADAHPVLRERFLALQSSFMAQASRELVITQTYRSPACQFGLFKKGRHLRAGGDPEEPHDWELDDPVHKAGIVTNCDGRRNKSRHNVYPAEAIDVSVDTDPGPGKHLTWDEPAYYPLGPLASAHGLIWGGAWHAIHDFPHLELPAGDA